jgi:hypothetical protein
VRPGQRRARRRQAAHHGARRRAQQFGRLAIRIAFDIDQQHGFALRGRQNPYRAQHLCGRNIRFDLVRAVDAERLAGVERALTGPDAPRPAPVEPDRPQDGEQPAVEPRAGLELVGAFDCPEAGRLDEILGDVARPR